MNGFANARRGEIVARLDGRDMRLCLTLGALAELETAFGAGSLVELAARFESRRLSARDLATIIAAGLRGAGQDVSPDEAAAMKCEDGLPGYAAIAAQLLETTFGGDNHRPPQPQGA